MKQRSLQNLFIFMAVGVLGSGVYLGSGANVKPDAQTVLAAAKGENGKVIEATEKYVEPGKNKGMLARWQGLKIILRIPQPKAAVTANPGVAAKLLESHSKIARIIITSRA